MASMSFVGLDELIRDFAQAAEIPDSVASEMLGAQAQVVLKAQKTKLQEKGLYETGQLRDSLQNAGMRSDGTTRYVDVYPKGTRKRKNGKAQRTRYRSRGRARAATNTEVGFIHEFGAPGKHIQAKRWRDEADEVSKEEQTEAARKVYDKFLQSKNL